MRKFGVVLLALGVFLIVLGPMLRFYVYPKVAVAPQAQNSDTTLVGPGATIFDTSTLKEIQTDLTTKARTVGDVNAAKQYGHNVVVWVTTSSTRSSDGVVRGRSIERDAFDATTAEAVNCCGEYVSNAQGVNTPVKHEGLLVKFPFQAEKKTYDFWDGDLGRAVPIKYVDTEKIQGLTVYKFAQTIPATKVGTVDAPKSILGLTGTGNVTADSMYSNTRTLWVEPVTGVIIKRAEAQHNTLDYAGEPRVTTTQVTTGYDDKTVKDNVDTYGALATELHLLYSVLPWLAPLIGLLLVIGGVLLARRAATTAPAAAPATAGPATA